MSQSIVCRESAPGELEVTHAGGQPLWRYVYGPGSIASESPRPFVHPLHSMDGDVLTNWRPNDHPWHHGLSFTLTSVNGVNFWGGPSHRAEDHYRWRDDQGVQEHTGWIRREAAEMVESLVWRDPLRAGAVMLEERRTLGTVLEKDGWRLRWTSRLHNPGREDLCCHNYHSLGGLEGSHYTGLQFRGARGLLDQHGDDAIRSLGEAGSADAQSLNGAKGHWLEWHGQADGSLRRIRIRFESLSGPIPWFVRPLDPLVAFSPHRESPLIIAAGETLTLDHALHFLRP